MSIQTELTRLTNAKAAIQAAVEGKGVTVPSGTLLDGMAALIDAIEAGGCGGGDIAPFSSVVCGTFTSGYTNTLTIDGVSNCKIFAMRCVENDYYAEDYDHTISAVLVNSETSSATSVGAVNGVSAYFSTKSFIVKSAGMYPTISGDTLTFIYYLLGTYEYVMVSK